MSFALGIEVTRACNFKCRHCFVNAGRRRQREMTTAQLHVLLRQAATVGVDSIGWSGGEPLLHPDLVELTGFATRLGMRTGLATNGYLATPTKLAALKQAGLRVVQVSVDGPDAARAARYRRGPRRAFERSLDAIRNSVAAGLQTYLCALLAPDTMAEVDDMIELGRSLGAAGLRYTMWAPVGRAAGQGYDEPAWAAAPWRPFFTRLGVLQGSRTPFKVMVDCPTGPLPGTRRYVCTAGHGTSYVTADGNLYPCTALLFPAYRVGNVLEQPYGLLVNDGRMLKVQREIAGSAVQSPCAGCGLLEQCRGGCPGRTYAARGRLQRGRSRLAMPVCYHRLYHSDGGQP